MRVLVYALRRLFLAVPLLLGITFISFLVIHLAPGEPVEIQTGRSEAQLHAQAQKALRELYGLDKPLHVQYWNWLSRSCASTSAGPSPPDGRPVIAQDHGAAARHAAR